MVNQVHHKSTLSEQTTSTQEINRATNVKQQNHQTQDEKTDGEEKLSIEEAQDMVGSMNDFLQSADSRLKFVLHDQLETYYVTIIDSETDEVIKEIPSEQMMNIRAAMKDFVGLLVDHKI